MADLVHVKGLDELQKFLNELPAKLEQNILRSALRAGANVVLPVAKANIRSTSGELADSLKVSTRAKGAEVKASISTKVFYAPFVEHGTRPHQITAKNRKSLSLGGLFFQSVQHPGARPHPFLRPALDTEAAAAVVAVGEQVKKRLTKEGLNVADVLVEGDE